MERRNTGWKVLVCLLLIALLGTSGFIAYDKVLKEKFFDKKDEKKTEEKTTKCDVGDEKTADELYTEYLEYLKEDTTVLGYWGEELDYERYYVELTKDNELYIHDKEDTKYEVATDVVQAFLPVVSPSGSSMLYYTKSDGITYSVKPYSYFAGENVTPEKIEYKNIVNITSTIHLESESGFVGNPLFVDIEGNTYTKE